MDWGFVCQLLHDAGLPRDLTYHDAVSRYSNVIFFSDTKLSYIPVRNGVLLPVMFFDEIEIGDKS